MNSGPGEKRKERADVSGSMYRSSVPVMSDGIRSGVNWMRLNESSRVRARLEIISVFARPGTPTRRQCPRVRIASRSWSMTSSWPTITRWSSDFIVAWTVRRRSREASSMLSSGGLRDGRGRPGRGVSGGGRSRARGAPEPSIDRGGHNLHPPESPTYGAGGHKPLPYGGPAGRPSGGARSVPHDRARGLAGRWPPASARRREGPLRSPDPIPSAVPRARIGPTLLDGAPAVRFLPRAAQRARRTQSVSAPTTTTRSPRANTLPPVPPWRSGSGTESRSKSSDSRSKR